MVRYPAPTFAPGAVAGATGLVIIKSPNLMLSARAVRLPMRTNSEERMRVVRFFILVSDERNFVLFGTLEEKEQMTNSRINGHKFETKLCAAWSHNAGVYRPDGRVFSPDAHA